MAKGVTENDVHAAADAVLAGGARPTVERIRAHLGTGSPNTVTRWLETWWGALGTRLTAQHTRLALPEAPTEVAAAASQLWELALERASGEADARLREERAGLATASKRLEQREAAAQAQVQAAFEEAAHAREALHACETRLADLQRLLEQQATQLHDLRHECGAGQARLTDLTIELARVRAQGEDWAKAAAVERDTLLQQLRGNEERAATEIDRARQHAQRLQLESNARERTQRHELTAARNQAEAKELELQASRREVDIQRARADALEKQLTRLADLPAHVEAALRRTRRPTKTVPAVAKRVKRASNSD